MYKCLSHRTELGSRDSTHVDQQVLCVIRINGCRTHLKFHSSVYEEFVQQNECDEHDQENSSNRVGGRICHHSVGTGRIQEHAWSRSS